MSAGTATDGTGASTDVRHPLQEIPPPASVPGGRLRLLDYPVLEPDSLPIETKPLELTSYRQATAIPLSTVPGTIRKTGAIYTKNLRLIRETERSIGKQGGPWHANPRRLDELPEPSTTLAGRSFFLGHWSPGFGHVLLELLPRLWPQQDMSGYDRFVVYPWRMDATPVMEHTSWLRDLLRLGGDVPLDKVVVLRDGPVRFERIDVSSPPFVLKASADPRFLDVFEAITRRVLADLGGQRAGDRPRRVYLSRSKMETRAATNEEAVEAAMERRGFTTLHPQLMTIAEQVAVLAGVEVIAGTDGSALHMAAFAKPGTKLLALDSRIVRSQFVIDRARGLDALHLLAVDEVIRRQAKWSADITQIESALDLLLAE